MKITLHIGLDGAVTQAMERSLAASRSRLARKGVLYPTWPGEASHTRLFLAVSGERGSLRARRGHGDPAAQAALHGELAAKLRAEIAAAQPQHVILSTPHLATLHDPADLARLAALFDGAAQIEVLIHSRAPAALLLDVLRGQIVAGRTAPLSRDIALLEAPSWWEAALALRAEIARDETRFPDIEAPPHWLDTEALARFWAGQFGAGAVHLRPTPGPEDPAALRAELAEAFALPVRPEPVLPPARPAPLTRLALARGLEVNALLHRLIARGQTIPAPLLQRLHRLLASPPDETARELSCEDLWQVTARFADPPHAPLAPWRDPRPEPGFRATQYVAAILPRIDAATRQARRAQREAAREIAAALSDDAAEKLPEAVYLQARHLSRSPFRPHDALGPEEAASPAFPEVPRAPPGEGSSGTVIVACMKNEAPYILEWIAHHRALGVDGFLIYTNDCSDGTAELLNALQAAGIVEHRDNSNWRGKSPQQHALNIARREPILRRAEWILHIDVDEFVNVHCGDGTLAAFRAHVPDATSVAMTWRLFGAGGIEAFDGGLVTETFELAAPRFCPKPHTAWGFKTLLRNDGAYGKLSCHRPNKLQPGFEARSLWVNGSGKDVTRAYLRNGWRSSKATIGYDLLQLNHYALRSAEAFLVKRARGRALHVDRSIGRNYWIRMDWSYHRDRSIQRNLPRLRAEMGRLTALPDVARWHEHGVAWHAAKAAELRRDPATARLYDEILALELTPTERAAYALTLDMES
ncbi:glycosyltransferase family 2 protein [Poseidonocella sedimentorum]|uniref:Glycosyl transferase family 2 n=1 Tax=Poseidonocella sedimentorum TaxID=871652 RepID=A0A1I6CUJ0_9RHOB|nr:glycosyltransferase family 2 protein [Poseidonocella sedimentorum]SFQ96848.1 Glycosyl transferase family 2 [Poseidonocella sedimentorum]